MVFQYNPLDYVLETTADGELLVTVARRASLSPRVRYNIHDLGRVVRVPELRRPLAEHGAEDLLDGALDLPFLLHAGRSDASVDFYGAVVTVDEVREALYAQEPLACAMRSFRLVRDEDGPHDGPAGARGPLVLAVELQPGELVSDHDERTLGASVLARLRRRNGDLDNACRGAGGALPDARPPRRGDGAVRGERRPAQAPLRGRGMSAARAAVAAARRCRRPPPALPCPSGVRASPGRGAGRRDPVRPGPLRRPGAARRARGGRRRALGPRPAGGRRHGRRRALAAGARRDLGAHGHAAVLRRRRVRPRPGPRRRPSARRPPASCSSAPTGCSGRSRSCSACGSRWAPPWTAVPTGALAGPVAVAVDRATTPLWFVAVYLVVVLLAPLTVRLHRRHGLRAVAGGVALVAALDVVRAAGPGRPRAVGGDRQPARGVADRPPARAPVGRRPPGPPAPPGAARGRRVGERARADRGHRLVPGGHAGAARQRGVELRPAHPGPARAGGRPARHGAAAPGARAPAARPAGGLGRRRRRRRGAHDRLLLAPGRGLRRVGRPAAERGGRPRGGHPGVVGARAALARAVRAGAAAARARDPGGRSAGGWSPAGGSAGRRPS